MPTDDEILVRVQHRATALRRRQRMLVAGAATVVMVALAGGVVVSGAIRDDGGQPVDVADAPATTSAPVDDAEACTLTSDTDLGTATAGPGGTPTAPADGSGADRSSSTPTTTASLPAGGDPAGAEGASTTTVEASSSACPLVVHVVAGYRPGAGDVELTVTALAEASYDAHGFVVWEDVPGAPVQEDLGALERAPGSCDAGAPAPSDAEPLRGTFTATHVYPELGAKEVVVRFWARRCGGAVHQVEVAVTVPL